MSTTPHIERHFKFGPIVRDLVIGMSDGLTVPFALAAGLSGVVASTHIVVTAGLAEIAAGSIAMGLGGYLAARSDAEHYVAERARERQEVIDMPEEEQLEVARVFKSYGLDEAATAPLVAALSARPEAWVDFMMRFELGLEEPDASRAWKSALTIALAYIGGGLIPLSPYFLVNQASRALLISVALTMVSLAVFGYAKGSATGVPAWRSAVQTTLIGSAAAGAAFLLAKAVT